MTRRDTTRLGNEGEDQALKFLLERGLRLEVRNHRDRMGEIDLIMRDGETLVFVEVRRRRSRRFGGAAASIDYRKRSRITRTALAYLSRRFGRCDLPLRFDVVAIDGPSGEVTWHRSAFA